MSVDRTATRVLLWPFVLLAATALLLAADGALAQPVRFVKHDAEGAGTGLSWLDAWTDVQTALANVEGEARIWVAAGRYTPGTGRSATFLLVDGVALCGGFSGNEDPGSFDLVDRNFGTNETILDGNIVHLGAPSNVFHVVTAIGTGPTARLGGFTITGGRANGLTSTLQDVGGGLLLIDAASTIRHCTVIGNEGAHGGGVYIDGGGPTFINSAFLGNHALACQVGGSGALGGAMYNVNQARPTLVNCLFSGNRAGCNLGGSGGAVFGGAALINCTLSMNRADTSGGALAGGGHRVVNSILWGNATDGGGSSAAQIAGSAAVSFSVVAGGHAGEGNIEDEPLFADADGVDDLSGTLDDDLRLLPGSPGIDAGDNTVLPAGVVFDLAGRQRLIDDPGTTDTGNPPGAVALVDMGAYEFQQPCQIDADCNDGNACHINRCDAGTSQCVHDTIECGDENECTDDRCDAALGCVYEDNETACDDGDPCTVSDRCTGGVCAPGPVPDCDDGNTCTTDTCDPASGCVHDDNTEPCEDGDACTTGDICADGVCVAGSMLDCDDGDACTQDSCDPQTGCAHVNAASDCDNGRFCDGLERCDPVQSCLPGTPPDCDDGVGCTVDACNEEVDACEHVPDDGSCDDGFYCNGAEACDAASGCHDGLAPDCDDQVICTLDQCDEAVDGCTHEPEHGACDNGLFCDGAEVCDPLLGCGPGAPPSCDDGVACTLDLCDETAGACMHGPDDALCDNGVFCDGVETCDLFEGCRAEAALCPGQVCDEAGERCVSCAVDSDCDDGDPCTTDQCADGTCGAIALPGCDDPGGGGPQDLCPSDPTKTGPGVCGCGTPDFDTDGDAMPDCLDLCPTDPNKTTPGACGCGLADSDADDDGSPNCRDECPDDPDKTIAGVCGCGAADLDIDEDGTADCEDGCPDDPLKVAPGICGCHVADTDFDEDAVADCNDRCLGTPAGEVVDGEGCPLEPAAEQPLPDQDSDGVLDGDDRCIDTPLGSEVDADGCIRVDDPPEPAVLRPGTPACGACGALGAVGWMAVCAGLVAMRGARRVRRL